MNRIRSLRLSKSLTQDELVAQMDHVITKQALSKYENDKATPSPKVAVALAGALGVTPSRLFAPPTFRVRFVAYRHGPSLSVSQRQRIERLLAEELEYRLLLQERMGLLTENTFGRVPVTTLDDAEHAATRLRRQWQLGTDPIANLTDLLERQNVHVLRAGEELDKFHGISAFAIDDDDKVRGSGVAYSGVAYSGVAYRDGVAGDRQRFTLAHELAHLVMRVSSDDPAFEEQAAYRFAGSLLMPAAEMTYLLGASRTSLSPQELLPLKKHFGTSLQAIVYRAKDLDIVSESFARSFFKQARQRGWHKQEPEPLPPEASQFWPHIVRRAAAQGQLTTEEARRWGAEDALPAPDDLSDPRVFLRLPKHKRDALLAQQAEQARGLYAPGSDLIEWTEDYRDEFVDDAVGIDDPVEVNDPVGVDG